VIPPSWQYTEIAVYGDGVANGRCLVVLPSLPGENPRVAVGLTNGVVYVVELEGGIECRDTRTAMPRGDDRRALACARRWVRLVEGC
jgi:hypothetical protein